MNDFMTSDIPEIGHVIKYSYLWWNEHRKGIKEGLKVRPCGVVMNRKVGEEQVVLYVLPITHTPPGKSEHGIEIPAATKKRLGLDEERSWIITTEYNKFKWPGYDIRKIPSGRYSYGILPEKLMRNAIESVKDHARHSELKHICRDD